MMLVIETVSQWRAPPPAASNVLTVSLERADDPDGSHCSQSFIGHLAGVAWLCGHTLNRATPLFTSYLPSVSTGRPDVLSHRVWVDKS